MTANHPESGSGAYAGGPIDTDTSSTTGGAKEQARQAAGTAADESKHVAGVAQDEARHVAGVAQGEAQRVAAEATSHVQHLVGQATSQVQDQSRTQLGRLAETLQSYGDDLEKMAAQSDGPAAGLAHEAAQRVQGLSSHLQGREPQDLLEDVRSYARRRPGLFLGGALVAGVVAGRLTRGAKAAQSSGPSGVAASTAGTPPTYPETTHTDTARTDTAYDVPSSGPVLDTTTQGHGTASGDPLAGTGRPATEPVYPGGSDVRGDLS